MGPRIAKRMVPDRLGSVPGVSSMLSRCGGAVPFVVCGGDGPKPLQHRLDKIAGQFDSAGVLVT